MTSPFLESSWKIKLGSKGQAVSSVSGFELLLLIWAKAQIIPLTQKTVFFLLLLLLLFFYGFFAGLFLLQFSIYRHENSQECWYYCHLGCYDFLWRLDMIESELFPKNKILQKTQHSVNIYSFSNLFFLFCSRVQAKPMVDIRHDLSFTVFKLEAIENDDFRENVKYLIS